MKRPEKTQVNGLPFRVLLASFALLIIVQVSGCGSKRIPVRPPEEMSDLVGILEVEGDTPFTRTMRLTDQSENLWTLEAPRFDGEINLLSGHTLRVTGYKAPGEVDDRLFVVTAYDLVAGQGMRALRGVIDERQGGAIHIKGDDGDCLLSGPLVDVLYGFKGFVVWVWGRELAAAGEDGQETIEVTGYEVLTGGQ